jgi:trehalose 6-phosphate phosphatase
MKDIFKNWREISETIKNCRYLLLLSDFDGTLCRIVPSAEQVRLEKQAKSSLKKIRKLPDTSLGIVSGRSLKEIKGYVGLRKIFYVGNHGFEIEYTDSEGRRRSFIHPAARRSRPAVKKIKKELSGLLNKIKGAKVEDKILTLSLHYRKVKDKDLNKVKQIFNKTITPYKRSGEIAVTRGKKVFEVRPPVDWHKGKAVLKIKKILNKKNLVTVYLGDDTTDEDVFKILKKKDIGIFVGRKRSSGAYYKIKDTETVAEFLNRLYILRRSREKS